MIAFGILIENTSKVPAPELADQLDGAANGEDWKWVLWELNRAYFAIILGSLAMKGRVSQIDDVEVITLGEAVDESEDSRSKWLFPSRSSSGSVHELAKKKIAQFISVSYGETIRIDDDADSQKLVKQEKRVLAPISTRRRLTPETPGAGALVRANRGGDMMAGVRSKQDENAETTPDANNSSLAPSGNVARKSRRGV